MPPYSTTCASCGGTRAFNVDQQAAQEFNMGESSPGTCFDCGAPVIYQKGAATCKAL